MTNWGNKCGEGLPERKTFRVYKSYFPKQSALRKPGWTPRLWSEAWYKTWAVEGSRDSQRGHAVTTLLAMSILSYPSSDILIRRWVPGTWVGIPGIGILMISTYWQILPLPMGLEIKLNPCICDAFHSRRKQMKCSIRFITWRLEKHQLVIFLTQVQSNRFRLPKWCIFSLSSTHSPQHKISRERTYGRTTAGTLAGKHTRS